MKPAFTLPEVLVAVIVLSVGILGLASSGTYLAIQAGEARSLTDGAVLAGSVLDSLRSVPCHSVTGGSLSRAEATVRWAATPSASSVAVSARLELAGRRGIRGWSIEVLIPCER